MNNKLLRGFIIHDNRLEQMIRHFLPTQNFATNCYHKRKEKTLKIYPPMTRIRILNGRQKISNSDSQPNNFYNYQRWGHFFVYN